MDSRQKELHKKRRCLNRQVKDISFTKCIVNINHKTSYMKKKVMALVSTLEPFYIYRLSFPERRRRSVYFYYRLSSGVPDCQSVAAAVGDK